LIVTGRALKSILDRFLSICQNSKNIKPGSEEARRLVGVISNYKKG
jgi:hypothetical protein